MIICLNVTNPVDARLVESHISFNDLRAFVCEDPDDLDLFMGKMKNELKLRVNAIMAPPQAANTFKPAHPISRYKKYGFQRYMQQLFTCPEPVMRYLCRMYNVHCIPVGSNEIKNNTARISVECPELTNYYTPEVQYSVKRSKYSNNISHRNTALKEPKALADSINVEKEQELTRLNEESRNHQKTKEEEYKVLQTESEKLVKEINDLREHKRTLMKKKDQRKALETQIKTKKQKIEFISTEELNIEEERKQLHIQLQRIVNEKLKHLGKIRDLSADCIKLAKKRLERSLRLAECSSEFHHAESGLRKAKQKYEVLEREVHELDERVADTKQQTREKLTEAKRAAGIGFNDDLEKALEERGVWQDFQNAPQRLPDLENEIYSMQARAEAMFMVDEEVVRDYEQREKEIKDLEKCLTTRESQHQNHHENISETKRKWNEDLRKLINEINENFSYFFSCLQCCGEVSLNIPENPEDYEKYGVCIKVKFRDHENLRELTAHHQSGGERSVATVLFMMALQELNKCPFRCVDEINQGMDPKNERKIFELVVQTVCKKSLSQYFLLTPKLLPDLEYDENMTVLCVYNGPGMMGHSNWKLNDFLRRRANIED
ncbi:structural maintenance of chromosomes protein 5-like [Plakobranchus ocellatus]|uniref:Structural maintenance of chromosomes protein 5 n=1 Tax=Plakobranchus ocellatus TaxID=259542 RepID=A0AAV4BZG0_9GAST|nr:structural maintenance of chromosomes protein 5-like [Plakobranchus ocellatus]